MVSRYHQMKLFTGTANPALAQEIADVLGVSLGGVRISRFANGEIYVRFDESIRGVDVFLIQPFSKPVNETLMELLIMIDETGVRRTDSRRDSLLCLCPPGKEDRAPGTDYRTDGRRYSLCGRR